MPAVLICGDTLRSPGDAPRGAARDRRPVPLPRDRRPPGGAHQRARGRPHRPQAPELERLLGEQFGRDELIAEGLSWEAIDRELYVRAVRELGIAAAVVPPDFPLAVADRLRAEGVELTPDDDLFVERRRRKTDAELAGIRRAAARRGGGRGGVRPRAARGRDRRRRAALRRRGADLRGAARAHPRGVRASRRAGSRRHHRGAHAPRRRRRPRGRQRAAARARPDLPGPVAAGRGVGLLGRHDAHVGARRHLRRGGRSAPARARGPRALARPRPGPECAASRSTARPATCSRPPDTPPSGPRSPASRCSTASSSASATASGSRCTRRPRSGVRAGRRSIAGDVVAVEPGVVDPEHGGMRVEDLVLVTDDGYELLTERSYDLVP